MSLGRGRARGTETTQAAVVPSIYSRLCLNNVLHSGLGRVWSRGAGSCRRFFDGTRAQV
jgi:hypothetical protein